MNISFFRKPKSRQPWTRKRTWADRPSVNLHTDRGTMQKSLRGSAEPGDAASNKERRR